MKWEQNTCPECGEPPVKLLEVVEAQALLQPNGKGGFEYAGESKMLWDTQSPHEDPDHQGLETLRCENDHEWETLRTEGEGEQHHG